MSSQLGKMAQPRHGIWGPGHFPRSWADITWTSEMSWFLPLATGLGVPEVVLKRSPPKPDLWKEFPRRNLVHNFFVGLPWGLLCRRPYLKGICRSSLGCVFFFFFSFLKLFGCKDSLLREKKYTCHSGGRFYQYLRATFDCLLRVFQEKECNIAIPMVAVRVRSSKLEQLHTSPFGTKEACYHLLWKSK